MLSNKLGAASGIGKAVVEQLLAKGAIVFACDINETGLKKAYESIINDNLK